MLPGLGVPSLCGRAVAGRMLAARAGVAGSGARLAKLLDDDSAAALSEQLGEQLDPRETFKCDVSDFTTEKALQMHSGGCGDPPEVFLLKQGEGGVYAGCGTLRLRINAVDLFLRLTDPEINLQVFSNSRSSAITLNYRNLIREDEHLGTRLFEVSKTGQWRIFGIPFNFESTVYALEDWRNLEIRHCLKTPGGMTHLSGFWRMVPLAPNETLVLLHNEGVPFFKLPWPLRPVGGRAAGRMAYELMESVRHATEDPGFLDPAWAAPDKPGWFRAGAGAAVQDTVPAS